MGGEKVLVPGNRLGECLAAREAAKVERLAPGVFVKIRRDVVVPADSGVSRPSHPDKGAVVQEGAREEAASKSYCLVRLA